MRQIEFTASGSSSVFGNFAPGDVLRCGAEEARHFVEEVKCAKYVDAQTAQPVATKRKRAKE
jgi:hypothetical protein